MDSVLVWMSLAFVAGATFGMMVTASALSSRVSPPTTVVMTDQRRPELLEGGSGCSTILFLMILAIGVALALVVLGS